MDFSEFAQISYPYLSEGRTEGDFVAELLINITEDSAPESFAPYTGKRVHFRQYFNGNRSMSRIAREALSMIDRDKFALFLDRFSVDTLLLLAGKLKEAHFEYETNNPVNCITQALITSLDTSALVHPGPKPKGSINRVAIENGLRNLLEGLANLQPSDTLIELEYTAVRVRQKIAAAGHNEPTALLMNKIERDVAQYYKYVEEQLRTLDASGVLYSNGLAMQVKARYEALRQDEPDAVVIYYKIRSWLMETSGCSNELAADIVTAFYIQNCEVFDAPSK